MIHERKTAKLDFIKIKKFRGSHRGSVETNQYTSMCRKDVGLIPGLAQWVKELVLLQVVA